MEKYAVLILAVEQSDILAIGQVFLKLGLMKMLTFGWNWAFWKSALLNWQFALCGICFGCASLMWMYIIKHFPLSTAYPLVSLSYVFGMLSAIVVFHEQVNVSKWLGVVLIILGCFIISKP